MPVDLNGIISDLEQRRELIDRALEAMRSVAGAATVEPPAPNRRGRRPGTKFSDETRRKMSEAQQRRFAAQRGGPRPQQNAPAARKRGLTAAGRKRLSELLKARWASKNPPKKRKQ